MTRDLSRETFDPLKHFSRVLLQQGSVQRDADWNEQAAILMHLVRRLAASVFPEGGGRGFGVTRLNTANAVCDDFAIGAGDYWVDGILCELEATPVAVTALDATQGQIVVAATTVDGTPIAVGQYVSVSGDRRARSDEVEVTGRITGVTSGTRTLTLDADLTPLTKASNLRAHRVVTYLTQPGGVPDSQRLVAGKQYQIYLDVWERPVISLEDGSIREVALDGPDTATRMQVVWQVRALESPPTPLDAVSHHYARLAVATVHGGAAPALETCVPQQLRPK